MALANELTLEGHGKGAEGDAHLYPGILTAAQHKGVAQDVSGIATKSSSVLR